MSSLISATELHDILTRPDVKILDASYPANNAEGIKTAQVFDIDAVADRSHPLPHMLPFASFFEESVRAFGINNGDTVILYDRQGFAMAAARGWWMFRAFGHEQVKILNGGLPAWIGAGFDLTPLDMAPPEHGDFSARFNPGLVKTAEDVLENIDSPQFQVLDVRHPARFEQEGHIPNSHNLFFGTLIDPQSGHLRDKAILRQTFEQADISLNMPIVTSCGSGVTACVGALALAELGITDVAVYDGSWSEWGARSDLPKD